MPSSGRTQTSPRSTVSGSGWIAVQVTSPVTSTRRSLTSWYMLAMDRVSAIEHGVSAAAPTGPTVPSVVSANQR